VPEWSSGREEWPEAGADGLDGQDFSF